MLRLALAVVLLSLSATAQAKTLPLQAKIVVASAPKCERVREKRFVKNDGWAVRTVAIRCKDSETGSVSRVRVKWAESKPRPTND